MDEILVQGHIRDYRIMVSIGHRRQAFLFGNGYGDGYGYGISSGRASQMSVFFVNLLGQGSLGGLTVDNLEKGIHHLGIKLPAGKGFQFVGSLILGHGLPV